KPRSPITCKPGRLTTFSTGRVNRNWAPCQRCLAGIACSKPDKPSFGHRGLPVTEDRISIPERTWIWGFALLLVAITGLPHLVAALAAPGTFSGFLIGVDDGNSYIAKMLSGANGA